MSDATTLTLHPEAEGIDVTAIIVNYNTSALLRPCIDALRASAGRLRLQIVIVDNASRDDSVPVLRRSFSDCDLILNPVNEGFGRANNRALAWAKGRYVLLLNTDAFVAPDSLTRTVGYMDENARCGILGVRLEGRDGELQPSCRYFPTPWNEFLLETGTHKLFPRARMVDDMAWDHGAVRACDWVPGCYYLVRRRVIETVGLFDPRYFLYYEEVDHCRAAKAAGWDVTYFPHTTVVHIGGESAKTDATITGSGRQISSLQVESGLLYYRKHHGWAGLSANVLLSTLGDAVMAAKWVLKRRTWSGVGGFWTHLRTVWDLSWRTRAGTRPTR